MIVLLLAVDLGRVFLAATNTLYRARAQDQILTTLDLPQQRANFYDRNGQPLTGYTTRYYALCIPGESSYTRLFEHVSYESQGLLYERRNSMTPFLVEVDSDLSGEGLYIYRGTNRYLPQPVAEHLLGYLNGEGDGVSGLELAFDELLKSDPVEEQIQCVTTAQGTMMDGYEPTYSQMTTGLQQGVQLTLDLALQRNCEGIAGTEMERGCIVVMECDTGKVLASVSVPDFDPENVARSIQAEDTSLINRVFSQYNVGSVFKPVVAAAALENGYDWYSYTCEGAVTIDDHVYRCAGGIAHDTVNLRGALEQSCNCYFIRLGRHLGGQTLLEMAQDFGFGQALAVAGGVKSAAGNLPDAEQLENSGQLAGFCFGQGLLLATPLQVAAMINTIANDGVYLSPSFLLGSVLEETGETVQNLYEPTSRRVIESDTARLLQSMLASVVTDGIGTEAQPAEGNAAGKTGTAQTGRLDEDGNEKMDYWFAGFYPAEDPQYSIVVLQDDLVQPQVSCARVFAQVCDALYYLQMVQPVVDNSETE